MLTNKCINPEIVHALSLCGHGSKVLITDGNYPLFEKTGTAKKVFLGLCPGIPNVTDVFSVIHSIINIEKAEVMVPEEGPEPPIFADFRKELGNMELSGLGRFEFYEACMQPGAVMIAISTGDQRLFSNILLTIGCA